MHTTILNSKPLVITEEEYTKNSIRLCFFLIAFFILTLLSGIEIGKQQIQKRLITDLQDGKVQCEVETYTSKDGFFKETRLGSISREIK